MMMMIRNPAGAGAGAGASSPSSSSSSSSSSSCIRAGIIINKKKRSLPCRRGSCGSSSPLVSPSSLRFGNGNGNGNGVGGRGGANLAFSRNVSSSSSSSSSNWNRRPLFLLSSDSRTTTGLVGAAAEIAEGGARRNEDDVISDCEPSNTSTTTDVLYLGALFGIWYLFNIYFSVYNKQVLNVYPFPLTISAFHFAIGTLFVLVMWTTNLYKRPNVSTSQLSTIVPLAIVHTMGNLFTNMSLGKVAVSFTHTIKAMEPFFTVVLSSLFLGEAPTIWVLSSLVPIVGGVALASLTEASFNWAGLWSAMASNLTYQSRNVLSKKLMANKEESLDNITLFSIITIMSFFLSVPVALFVEGITFTPSYIQSAGLSVREIYTRSILAGLCFHAYQQVAYMILAKVSPVSHSIGNCVKRVVIIVSSVLFFRTPVSPINSLGTGVALAGVFMYSRVKNIKAKAS